VAHPLRLLQRVGIPNVDATMGFMPLGHWNVGVTEGSVKMPRRACGCGAKGFLRLRKPIHNANRFATLRMTKTMISGFLPPPGNLVNRPKPPDPVQLLANKGQIILAKVAALPFAV
jgi:hypothetical protein